MLSEVKAQNGLIVMGYNLFLLKNIQDMPRHVVRKRDDGDQRVSTGS